MGNENSRLVDDSVEPQTLRERSLTAVAELIRDGGAKRIVVFTGAGISTAAGIPDFRSPKTGLYANLARLNLPRAEAVFDISFFRSNPEPFYVLARELYPGRFRPTISHAFIALLARKGLLCMLFTQNIDCLERAAGVPPKLIVEAHGSFASQRCIECLAEYPDDLMREHVEAARVPRCLAPPCGGLVKPDITFFGEKLPDRFDQLSRVPAVADLAVVVGTSLSVWPFAGLPRLVSPGVPRVLFNMDAVGDLGGRADDVLELGPCDEGIRKLADELGWREELEALWRDVVGEEEAERQLEGREKVEQDMEEELNKLTDQVGRTLHIGDEEPVTVDGVEEGHVARMARVMDGEIGPLLAPKVAGEMAAWEETEPEPVEEALTTGPVAQPTREKEEESGNEGGVEKEKDAVTKEDAETKEAEKEENAVNEGAETKEGAEPVPSKEEKKAGEESPASSSASGAATEKPAKSFVQETTNMKPVQ